MSFRSLLDREVSIVPVVPGVKDRYGNASSVAGEPIDHVPARRDQVRAGEDVRDRDQQTREFVYSFPLRSDDGDELELTGYGRIVDGDDTFEIVGTPELLHRRRRPHHWEARAVLVEG